MIRVRAPRVLITRSKKGNMELSERLNEVGFESISMDTISFVPSEDSGVDKALMRLASFDWLIFSSSTGVKSFVQRMRSLGIALPEGSPKVAAVGPGTALELTRSGLKASFVPSRYLTERLGRELPLDGGRRVLLLRTNIADPNLVNLLVDRGFDVEEQAVYKTVLPAQMVERIPEVDIVTFASPSAVEGLCRMVSESQLTVLRMKKAYCIGPITAQAAREHGFSDIVVPDVHTLDALVVEMDRSVEK